MLGAQSLGPEFRGVTWDNWKQLTAGWIRDYGTDPSSNFQGVAEIGATLGALGTIEGREAVLLSATTSTGKVVIDRKIGDQLGERGWTPQDVQSTVNEGPIGTTFDKRSAAKTPDGVPRNDPASVYGTKSGYIVVNDRTGEVFQVSDKTDPAWVPDSRIKWR